MRTISTLPFLFFMVIAFNFSIETGWAGYKKAKSPFSQGQAQLLEWEYNANAVAKNRAAKSVGAFRPQYFLVPKEKVIFRTSVNAPASAKASEQFLQTSLQVTVGDKEYVRWFINPEDTYHVERMKFYLKKNGFDDAIYTLEDPQSREADLGYKTASRSSAIAFPQTAEASATLFTFKASTDRTGGQFTTFKKVGSADVERWMSTTELTDKVNQRLQLGNLVTVREPLGMTMKETSQDISETLNQGIAFRSYPDLGVENGPAFLLPGFAAIHGKTGSAIARLNKQDPDSKNPGKYWRKHFAEQVGKATADFILTHQMCPSSAHAQQYLIGLDKNKIPTGKIYFRDFNDSDPMIDFLPSKFFSQWGPRSKSKTLDLNFRLFHGSVLPSWLYWLNYKERQRWEAAFIQSFETRLAELLNISLEDLKSAETNDPKKVTSKSWDVHHPIFKNWLSARECFRGELTTVEGKLNCDDVLDCFNRKSPYSRNKIKCTEVMDYLVKGMDAARPVMPPIPQAQAEGTECSGNPYRQIKSLDTEVLKISKEL
jgi:hypothetical protein